MSVSLADPRISTAYATLQQPTSHTNNILLGYFGSTTISLYNEGSGGIDEVRSFCDPAEVRFALLKMQEKYLFIQFMGEQISGVKRARALVHGKAVARIFACADASVLITKAEELTDSMVKSKLRIITHSSPSSPIAGTHPASALAPENGIGHSLAGLRVAPSQPSTNGTTHSARDDLSPATTTASEYARAMPTDVGPFMPPGVEPLPPVAPLKLTRKSSSPRIGKGTESVGATAAVEAGPRARSGSGSAGEAAGSGAGGTLRRASVDEVDDMGSGRKRSGSLSKEKANERWADAIAAYPLPLVAGGPSPGPNAGHVEASSTPQEGKSGYNPLADAAAAAAVVAAATEAEKTGGKYGALGINAEDRRSRSPSGEVPVVMQRTSSLSKRNASTSSSSTAAVTRSQANREAAVLPEAPAQSAVNALTANEGEMLISHIPDSIINASTTATIDDPVGNKPSATSHAKSSSANHLDSSFSSTTSPALHYRSTSAGAGASETTPASLRAYRRKMELSGYDGESWVSRHTRRMSDHHSDEDFGYTPRLRGSPPHLGLARFAVSNADKDLPAPPDGAGGRRTPEHESSIPDLHSFTPNTRSAITARKRFDTAEHATHMQLQKARAKQASVGMQLREIERRENERARMEEMTRERWNRQLYLREKLDAFERSKLESAERLRRAGVEQVRREEARKLEQLRREKKQAEDEEREALEESERRRRDSAARETSMKLAAREKKQREAESAARELAKQADRRAIKQEFQKLGGSHQKTVIISGGISVQQPNSTIFKRRFFEVTGNELCIYKSEDDKTETLNKVQLQGTVSKIEDAFEEVQMAHSFCLTFKPRADIGWPMDTFTAYVDSKEQKELLLTAIEVISKGE